VLNQTIDVVMVDINDDGAYAANCPNGHHPIAAIWEAARFEILFDAGVHALANGYAREAIADFISSLEDFFLFYVRVVCRLHNVPAEHLEPFEKSVRNASERRWGAMYLAHLMHERRPFSSKLDDDKRRKLRNRVVHTGYICTFDEAFDYAGLVYDEVKSLLASLRASENGGEAIDQENITRSVTARKKIPAPPNRSHSSMLIHTMLGLNVIEQTTLPFKDAYEQWVALHVGKSVREDAENP
jgi:hypothetical protein